MFSVSDGLSADDVGTFFEDREGNTWMTTVNGLEGRDAVQGLRSLPVINNDVTRAIRSRGVPSTWTRKSGRFRPD
jgi:hypothetical protein